MLKKMAVVCSMVMLLGTAVFAGPAKGKIVVTAPVIGAQGLVWMGSGYDSRSFGDNGFISVFGSGQISITSFPAMYGTPWSFGYCITDNLELGLNIAYLNPMSDGDDSLISLGIYGVYYFSMGKIMPFIKAGFTIVDIKEFDNPTEKIINGSIGVAYAISETVAPYLSIDINTVLDTGTKVDLTLGLKFMF